MAKRFLVETQDIAVNGNNVYIKGNALNHIFALRYKVGDKIVVNDSEIEIVSFSKDVIGGRFVKKIGSTGVPLSDITLVQGYLKADKMEYVVQKAVEIGVRHIIPVTMENSVVKLDEKDVIKKRERLLKIVSEAIGQCGRTDEVELNIVRALKEIDFESFDLVLVCHEKSATLLSEVLSESKLLGKRIAVVIGPEGGLSGGDIESIHSLSKFEVSFGERILRAETASIYVLSILDYLT